MGLSWWHLAIVLVLFVILFGAGRISGLMSDVAKGLRSFNRTLADKGDDEEEVSEVRLLKDDRSAKSARSGRASGKRRAAAGRESKTG